MRKTASLLFLLVLGTAASASDFTGTWKLNLDKSKLRADMIAAETMTIQQTGPNTYRNTFDATLKSGKRVHSVRDRVYDGKEHPVQSEGAGSDESEMCKFAPDGSRVITQKKGGKPNGEIKSTVSSDGHTLTNVHTLPDGGQETLVFDKQ